MESFAFFSLLTPGIVTVLLVHEVGHLVLARYFGFKVLSLSIGLGPQLLSFTDGSGTTWKLRAIPIGGSCVFDDGLSENGGPVLRAQTLQRRAVVYASGPIFNLIFAMLCGVVLPTLCTNCALYSIEVGTPEATLIRLLAEFSVGIAVFNLLPVLPLDGSRLCLTAIEAGVGRDISAKCEAWFSLPSILFIGGITTAYFAWTAQKLFA
jgi:regulator of sigma E protease